MFTLIFTRLTGSSDEAIFLVGTYATAKEAHDEMVKQVDLKIANQGFLREWSEVLDNEAFLGAPDMYDTCRFYIFDTDNPCGFDNDRELDHFAFIAKREAKALAHEVWDGEGYYRIGWRATGEWTCDGPKRFESEEDLAWEITEMIMYTEEADDIHASKVRQFHRYELDDLLGEFADDYDVDGIIDVATGWCSDGKLYWLAEGDELTKIIESFEKHN